MHFDIRTNNHASTSSLNFYRLVALSNAKPTRSNCWYCHPIISCFIMVALWNRADHYIFILWFLLSFFFFFFLAFSQPSQKVTKKSPSGHHRTTLPGYIFTTEAHMDNRKKLVKQQYVFHTSSQYGELRPTRGWDWSGSFRHPCKFQRLSRLGSVTAWHLVVGSGHHQTLRRWTEGATYVRQGDHHVGHWPTF